MSAAVKLRAGTGTGAIWFARRLLIMMHGCTVGIPCILRPADQLYTWSNSWLYAGVAAEQHSRR